MTVVRKLTTFPCSPVSLSLVKLATCSTVKSVCCPGNGTSVSVVGAKLKTNNERKTMNEIFSEMDSLVSDFFGKIDEMTEGK